jgi:cysteine desulfurase
LRPDPILFGGGHENERRAGTENLAGIVGMVRALELFVKDPVFKRTHLEPLADTLVATINSIPGVRLVSAREKCLANTVSVVVEDSDSSALLAGLDLEGICASSGSACSAGSLEPSHVITAMGFEEKLANALLRFSLGRHTTLEEINYVSELLPGLIRRTQVSE